jgi:P27 family predicted phage terminase small subunit
MAGRKKKPTALRIAEGSIRPSRHDPEAEPQYREVAEMPEPPGDLDAAGRGVWFELGAKLAAAKVLTEGSLGAFAMYCRCIDEIAACDHEIERDGRTVFTKGGMRIHPLAIERHKWIDRKARYESQFGLTPATKAGLRVTGDSADDEIKPRARA